MVKEIAIDPLYLKIAVMVAVMYGLYLLARGTSRQGPDEIAAPEPPQPAPITMRAAAGGELADPTFAPVPGAEAAADRVVIRQHSFRTFDPIPGPPDPADFMDDLLLVVYYPETDHTAEMEYTVATPAGMARAIAASPDKCVQLPPDSFVVARYDHDVILRSVLAHLCSQQEPEDRDRSSFDAGSGSRF